MFSIWWLKIRSLLLLLSIFFLRQESHEFCGLVVIDTIDTRLIFLLLTNVLVGLYTDIFVIYCVSFDTYVTQIAWVYYRIQKEKKMLNRMVFFFSLTLLSSTVNTGIERTCYSNSCKNWKKKHCSTLYIISDPKLLNISKRTFIWILEHDVLFKKKSDKTRRTTCCQPKRQE